MDAIKEYLLKNFEQLFVLSILVSVAGINYYIPYKLAFLNFYFIPIMLVPTIWEYERLFWVPFFVP